MKFAILTDIHVGPEGYHNNVLRKINKDAKKLVSDFVEKMNREVNLDFVIVLGDLIEDENPENDKANVEYVVESLKELSCPVYYVAGNHDLKNISQEELKTIFKQDELFHSFDFDAFHFVVLFSEKSNGRIVIAEEQTEWLRRDLQKSTKPCVVFVHHGLADQNLTHNPWFEGRPKSCLISNRKKIRKMLENSGKVIAVFNSHLHWNKKNIHRSIPYYTIQSLTENEGDHGVASEAYAIVNILDRKVGVSIEGNYKQML